MRTASRISVAIDATSASAHARHNAALQSHGVQVIDLTPAAIGPYVVPVVNIEQHQHTHSEPTMSEAA